MRKEFRPRSFGSRGSDTPKQLPKRAESEDGRQQPGGARAIEIQAPECRETSCCGRMSAVACCACRRCMRRWTSARKLHNTLFNDVALRHGVARLLDQHVRVFKISRSRSVSRVGPCTTDASGEPVPRRQVPRDMAQLQQSEAGRRIFGACRYRIRPPAGTFCGGSTSTTRRAAGLPRRTNVYADHRACRAIINTGKRRMRNRELAVVDLDGHVKHLYGM